MSLLSRLSAVAAIASLATACVEGSPIEVNPEPATITVLPKSGLIVRTGDEVPLTVRVLDRNGNGVVAPVTFSSDHPEVATVGDGNVLRAGSTGTARIGASAGKAGIIFTVEVQSWPRTVVASQPFGATVRGDVALIAPLDVGAFRLDPVNGDVLATYDFASSYVSLNQDGSQLFLSNVALDLGSGSLLRNIVADGSVTCGHVYAAVERPGGGVIYASCDTGILEVSSTTGAIQTTLPTSFPATLLVLEAAEQRVYGVSPTAARIYEINTQSNALVRQLVAPGGPQGLVRAAGNELYVAMESDKQIEKWDLSIPAITDSLPLVALANGAGPFDLARSEDGNRLLTSVGPMVDEIDRASFTVSKTYWVGGHARRIAVTGGHAIIANEGGWVDILPF